VTEFRPSRRRFLRGLGGATVAAVAAGPAAVGLAGAALAAPLAADGARRDEERGSAIPVPGQRLGAPRLVWSVNTDRPWATLSFDDGPDPELTPTILDVLARHRVRANFNVMGHNAERHPDLLRAVVAAGHEIGNHTWTHLDLAREEPATTRQQLVEGLARIRAVVDTDVRWFRPPRGILTGLGTRVAAELGHDILMWSVTRGPEGVGTPKDVLLAVGEGTRPGDIVCLHDGIGRGTFEPDAAFARELLARRRVEVAALPAIVERLLGRGLRLVTASELLAAERPLTRAARQT
jgi:peptidoglycan/xylan/chitin deacetylase (PgdA/CDA1 family)